MLKLRLTVTFHNKRKNESFWSVFLFLSIQVWGTSCAHGTGRKGFTALALRKVCKWAGVKRKSGQGNVADDQGRPHAEYKRVSAVLYYTVLVILYNTPTALWRWSVDVSNDRGFFWRFILQSSMLKHFICQILSMPATQFIKQRSVNSNKNNRYCVINYIGLIWLFV